MRVVITGGSGFLGKPVINILLRKGHSIIALSRTAEAYNLVNTEKSLEWINTSLEMDETCFQQIKDFKPEAIVHLAWEKIPDFSFETCLHNLNSQVTFFKHICQLSSIKKIIVAGSCFEYNQSFGECLESDICTSTNYFNWAKNTLRDFLQFECFQKKINLIWARIFYVYGPGQKSGSIMPVIIKNLQDGKLPDLRKPFNANDFVYVDDVAEGFSQLLEKEIESGIYNLGSGKSTSVVDVLRMIDKQFNNIETIADQVLTNANQPFKEMDAWANIEKTSNSLDWQPSVKMEEGIRKLINSIA